MPLIPIAALPGKIKESNGYRHLINPELHTRLDGAPKNSELRTRVLLALLPSEPDRAYELADRLSTCGLDEHWTIRETLRDRWPEIAPRLRELLSVAQTDPGRCARAAAALIALEQPERPEAQAWAELRLTQDPTVRVELLDWLVRMKTDPHALATHLEIEPDVSVQRQVIQALGALGQGQTPPNASAALPARYMAMYHDHPDPGVHASLAYLLRRWGMDSEVNKIDLELAGKPRDGRGWYANSFGMTMAIIVVPEDQRPLPPAPCAPPARFAIATTETTLELYSRFDPKHAAMRRLALGREPPTIPDAPADKLSYFDAARFCNWLSEIEGIPPDQWCYVPGEAQGISVLAPDYRRRRGYRLPTLAEWEFAARAGTTTDRYFGADSSHIDDYAWHRDNAPHPEQNFAKAYAASVGRLRPNDFGLFDMIGNMFEWCYNPASPPNQSCNCRAGKEMDRCEMRPQALKGGCFAFVKQNQGVRDWSRHFYDMSRPTDANWFQGFRIARNEP